MKQLRHATLWKSDPERPLITGSFLPAGTHGPVIAGQVMVSPQTIRGERLVVTSALNRVPILWPR